MKIIIFIALGLSGMVFSSSKTNIPNLVIPSHRCHNKNNFQFFNGLIDYDYDYNIYLNQFLRNKPFTFNGKIYN